MNRKDRRRMQKAGKEPIYTLKPSNIATMVTKGPARQAMRAEINRQILDQERQFTIDVDTMVLWTLHSCYGWGAKRLKEFYVNMFREHIRMRKFYELDDLYPERHKLKEAGADVEAWFNALFDEAGNLRGESEVTL